MYKQVIREYSLHLYLYRFNVYTPQTIFYLNFFNWINQGHLYKFRLISCINEKGSFSSYLEVDYVNICTQRLVVTLMNLKVSAEKLNVSDWSVPISRR